MRKLLLLLAMLIAPAQARTVTATVYDPWYHNRADACGGIYHHWGTSAAHPWLPCGTKIRVTHGSRSLMVRITDRCDCNSIDLLAGAAYRLRVPLDGVAKVEISY
jgi:rare lipoprotein A